MPERVTVIGGGHGLAAVLAALRGEPGELTVVVTVADDGGSSGELRRRYGGAAVGDLRRALLALADEDTPLARALARPITVEHFGRHPIGNLLLHALAEVLGDLTQATDWLRVQLGIRARVLPATVDAVSLLGEAGGQIIVGESAIGASDAVIRRLRFSPERPRVTEAALDAIRCSDYVLLGPGSLFTSVLAVCALPDVACALAETSARIVWIANLEPQAGETGGMSARNHLAVLRRHGVRVDAVLYDPWAALSFAPEQLVRSHIEPISYPLQAAGETGIHCPALLRDALTETLAGGRHAAFAAC